MIDKIMSMDGEHPRVEELTGVVAADALVLSRQAEGGPKPQWRDSFFAARVGARTMLTVLEELGTELPDDDIIITRLNELFEETKKRGGTDE